MSERIESKVAQTVLQRSKEITIGEEVFNIAPPSTATLILVSEEISKLPNIELDNTNIAAEALYVAKDCRALGDIVATLILGAKGLKTTEIIEQRRFFGLLKERREVVIDKKAELAKKLLEDIEPIELHNLALEHLQRSQISDFFGLTTFLIEINLLRQTKKVVKKMTVSGQS